jgi:DNA-binding transcriptional MerR regulator
MEYTVQKLAAMAGVSARALRYYDQVGLLKPARTSRSGYRLYGEAEIDRLQQILFYRELGVDLDTIRSIVAAPAFDRIAALRDHRTQLIEKRAQLDRLIDNVDRSLAAATGRETMQDKDKFSGFGQKLVDENEAKHGAEARRRWGDAAVDGSNAKVAKMTEAEHQAAAELAKAVIAALLEAMDTGDAAGEKARRTVELHKRWLMIYWDKYTPAYHAGLGRMYVEDDRFRANYDRNRPGAAEFLRDAILAYTGEK